jgi:hypothetical protein
MQHIKSLLRLAKPAAKRTTRTGESDTGFNYSQAIGELIFAYITVHIFTVPLFEIRYDRPSSTKAVKAVLFSSAEVDLAQNHALRCWMSTPHPKQ